jgi:hypothetical protein
MTSKYATAHAAKMRLRARGNKPCRACRSSGVRFPTRAIPIVCGACYGRGYLIPREVSSGSWFQDPDRHWLNAKPEAELSAALVYYRRNRDKISD